MALCSRISTNCTITVTHFSPCTERQQSPRRATCSEHIVCFSLVLWLYWRPWRRMLQGFLTRRAQRLVQLPALRLPTRLRIGHPLVAYRLSVLTKMTSCGHSGSRWMSSVSILICFVLHSIASLGISTCRLCIQPI